MSNKPTPNINELISALELHLTPRTDPNHCDPCPYNEGKREEPQSTCQYRLMRDCLEALKLQKTHITILESNAILSTEDFISFFVDIFLPEQYKAEDAVIGRTAFDLGLAFGKWKEAMGD